MNPHFQAELKTDLKFFKTAGEIRGSIAKKTSKLTAKSNDLKVEIQVICARREIDPAEVYTQDSDQIAAYSSKMYQSVPQVNEALRALEKDISKLRENSAMIENYNKQIEDLMRVSDNLLEHDMCTLSYSELVLFGF